MKDHIQKIIIDPRSRINYSAYYILGFASLYGRRNLKFGLIDVPGISDQQAYYQGCTMLIVDEEKGVRKVFIDPHDTNTVNEQFYNWSDVYAKINVTAEDAVREKILVIGPSFGIQLWNPFHTMWIGVCNLLKCRIGSRFNISAKSYLLDYAYTFVRRQRIKEYLNTGDQEKRDYVFALSTLWYDSQTYSTTNRFRGVFAEACKSLYPVFEGGFFFIPSEDVARQFPRYREYLEKYKDMLITKRIGMKEYLTKTKRSAIVFNTPSVLGCHGWKLGEYLAMGKAIISTPLNNMMPGDYSEGVHYIGVSGEQDIFSAVKKVKEDEALRLSLKNNARTYYDAYLSPKAVVSRIVKNACNCSDPRL